MTPSTAPGNGGGCASGSAQFCETFAAPDAFATRFDHGWAGELHAGSGFSPSADKSPFPGDHDGTCGDPNNTRRMITMGPGHFGENSPASSSDMAFYQCAPGGDPAKAHVMTAANTEGYVIPWFSPKPTFTNVHRVCVSVSDTFLGNGIWWQMVFLTPTEVARKPVIDGTTYNVLDLGYTSPDFPAGVNGPTTPQGTAGAGIKFQVNGSFASDSRLKIRPWTNGGFTTDSAGIDAGPGTSDHAPRYPMCVTDNENGTLTFVNGSPDGTTHTTIIPGAIPNGQIRVVFEQDEYNPDKHRAAGEIGSNMGEGLTLHWDDISVS